eukprot:scpid53429/ scgid20993/ 
MSASTPIASRTYHRCRYARNWLDRVGGGCSMMRVKLEKSGSQSSDKPQMPTAAFTLRFVATSITSNVYFSPFVPSHYLTFTTGGRPTKTLTIRKSGEEGSLRVDFSLCLIKQFDKAVVDTFILYALVQLEGEHAALPGLYRGHLGSNTCNAIAAVCYAYTTHEGRWCGRTNQKLFPAALNMFCRKHAYAIE